MTNENEHRHPITENEPRPEIMPGTIVFIPGVIGSNIYVITGIERDSDGDPYCSFVELNDQPNLRPYGWIGGAKASTIKLILGQESVDLATKVIEFSNMVRLPGETDNNTDILDKYRTLLTKYNDK
jgi:hypothetical protein